MYLYSNRQGVVENKCEGLMNIQRINKMSEMSNVHIYSNHSQEQNEDGPRSWSRTILRMIPNSDRQ